MRTACSLVVLLRRGRGPFIAWAHAYQFNRKLVLGCRKRCLLDMSETDCDNAVRVRRRVQIHVCCVFEQRGADKAPVYPLLGMLVVYLAHSATMMQIARG